MTRKKDNPDSTYSADAKAVAALMGVTPSAVRKWAAARRLPGSAKIAGTWRFDLDRIRRWLEAGGELSETDNKGEK